MTRQKASIADRIRHRLKRLRLKEADVMWVGSMDGLFRSTWAEFVAGPGREKLRAAYRLYHPRRSTGTGLPTDLVIVGDGWWLQRDTGHRYSFVLCRAPSYDPQAQPILKAHGYPGSTLARLHQDGER